MDLELPEFDFEWDQRAGAISATVILLVAAMMFSDNFGFDTYPLLFKIIIMVLGAPVTYFVALYMINK